MCPHRFDQDTPKLVRHMHNQPVLVSGNIENHSIILQKIHISPEHLFDIVRFLPFGMFGQTVPGRQRQFYLRVFAPKILKLFSLILAVLTPR